MTLLSMRFLGNPEITLDQQPLSFPTRKTLALLIYLVLVKGMHSREALMALLWPESSSKNAAVNLRGTLSRLRKALLPAGEVLLSETGKVGFDFSQNIDLDLAWLAAAALTAMCVIHTGVTPLFNPERARKLPWNCLER